MIRTRSADYLPSPHGQRLSLASSFLQFRPPTSGKLLVPVKLLISVLAVVFTCVPCVVWWYFISSAVKVGVNSVREQGRTSLNSGLETFRLALLSASKDVFTSLATPTESAVRYSNSRLKSSGILNLSTEVAVRGFPVIADAFREMAFMVNASRYIYASSFDVFWNATYNLENVTWYPRQYSSYARLNGNLLTGKSVNTLYLAQSFVTSDLNDSFVTYYYLNPTTAAPSFAMYQQDLGHLQLSSGIMPSDFYWNDHIIFSPQSGLPELVLYKMESTKDLQSWFGVFYYTSVYDITDLLRNALHGRALDRMFVCFDNPSGVLLGASHGKFFSHSDIDFRMNNPLNNPPPLSQLRTYTALNSTDELIYGAGVYLLERYGGWEKIPGMIEDVMLEGQRYWLSVSPMESEMGLKVLVVLLINVNSRVGPIDTEWNRALDSHARSNQLSLIILMVVLVGSFGVAVGISVLISRPLDRLVYGMRSLVLLDLEGSSGKLGPLQSFFSEVKACEDSFAAVARGMKAFVKYVPREVVTLMCQELPAQQQTASRNSNVITASTVESQFSTPERRLLCRRVVTILQADIAGFTTICENISPKHLEALMSEYLQAMCGIIVSRQGTLDKYIGDCIMALWNAPSRVKQQDVLACKAVLEMQQELVRLWDSWEEIGGNFPKLRFRAGLHTDHVLVGNIGCEYRISYTCLGETMYLAGHLEDLNKTYGTVVIVSENTMSRACSQIAFRKLGTVTLPGASNSSSSGGSSSNKLTIFEPLFERSSTLSLAEQQQLVLLQQSPVILPSAVSIPRSTLGESSDFGSPGSMPRLRSNTVTFEKEELFVCASSKILRSSTNPESTLEILPTAFGDREIVEGDVLYCWEQVPKATLDLMVAYYQQGLDRFEEGRYADTLNCFLQSAARLPQFSTASKLMVERCTQMLASSNTSSVAANDAGVPLVFVSD